MKRILLSMIISSMSIFACQQLKAQSQLKVGLGDGAIYNGLFNFADDIGSVMGAIFTGHDFKSDTKVSVPYIFVDYRYSLSDKVSIGAQLGYMGLQSKIKVFEKNGDLLSDVKTNSSIFIVMPGIDVRYFKINKFKMYGNLMAGMSFSSSKVEGETESDSGFVFQFNPVGFSYGESTAVFLEAGVGASIFNGGVRFSL